MRRTALNINFAPIVLGRVFAQPIPGEESSQRMPPPSDWFQERSSTNHELPFCLREILSLPGDSTELPRRSQLPGETAPQSQICQKHFSIGKCQDNISDDFWSTFRSDTMVMISPKAMQGRWLWCYISVRGRKITAVAIK